MRISFAKRRFVGRRCVVITMSPDFWEFDFLNENFIFHNDRIEFSTLITDE